jgi:hypothetical protein
MTEHFYKDLDALLNTCELASDERLFLEELAEFMVFPDRDPAKDPRNVFARSINSLKKNKCFLNYKNFIYEYQRKMEKK